MVRAAATSSREGIAPAPAPASKSFDFLVIGSGIAGLSYALQVAEHGTVAVLTKDEAQEGSTRYAQGGICAVLDPLDSVESHATDTMVAGDFLCDMKVVEMVCRESTEAVLELVKMGANFDRTETGELHLTREGGHAHTRVVHSKDLTGAEISRTLLQKARAHPNITILENFCVTDLITEQIGQTPYCIGCDAFSRITGQEVRFVALATMLASGGSGHIYPSTTNPTVATGDGIAMAARAGANICNMEFMQFHPTSLFIDGQADSNALKRDAVFLISEAVRGEGGHLLNGAGERFMKDYDPRMELAPRDVVARAINDQCKRRKEKCAYIDISHKSSAFILHHFPNIAAKCLEHGIDITKEPIPVLPAMHYTCGGVETRMMGETSIPGLFACGEAAYTGLHGANRLASNSLLEGLVYGRRAAQACIQHAQLSSKVTEEAMQRVVENRSLERPVISNKYKNTAREIAMLHTILALRRELQDENWSYAGIVRTTSELVGGLQRIKEIGFEACQLTVRGLSAEVTTEWFELANLLTVSELVVMSALMRKESRGLHYNLDYPYKVEGEKKPTRITASLKLATNLSTILTKKKYHSSLLLSKTSTWLEQLDSMGSLPQEQTLVLNKEK